MSYPLRYHAHKGFSLIELLIVILIISMVYFLGFDGIELNQKKTKPLNPLTLKSTIESSALFEGQATFLCINNCKSCYLRHDISSAFEEYTNPIDLKNVKAYTLDRDEALVPVEYERYQDKKICLIMEFYPNGSSTQIILEKDQKSYFLPAFFAEAKAFSSLDEAKEYWLRNSRAVANSGDFY